MRTLSQDEAKGRHFHSTKRIVGLGSNPRGGMAEAPVTNIRMSSIVTSGTSESVMEKLRG